MITRDALIKWACANGYSQDSWGHFQKTHPGVQKDGSIRVTRLKISNSHVRYDTRSCIGSRYEWLRVRSGYLKDVGINDNGQLTGLTR